MTIPEKSPDEFSDNPQSVVDNPKTVVPMPAEGDRILARFQREFEQVRQVVREVRAREDTR